MDILFAATELAPYAKAGGLADVMAALTKTLRQHGHKVTLALPRYRHFERAGLLVARRLTPLHFELGGSSCNVTVYDGRLPSGVDITLLDLPGFFDREGIYGEGASDYPDNPVRFAAFCCAVVELARQRLQSDNPFDVVHAHDWPTALVPFYAHLPANQALATASRFLLTVHNLEFQGIAPASMLDPLGIPREHFHPEGAEFYGSINILKTGMLFADALTTVSETYAREIQTEQRGGGLHGVLASRASRLAGIPNGVDYALWNPATDPALIARYDAEDPSSKGRCKAAMLVETGLEMVPERPVIAFADRFAERKGFDLLLDAIPMLVRSDVAFVLAGDGDSALTQRVCDLAARSSGRIALVQRPNDALLHRIVAGADMVIVPSRYEPCGQMQQCGQRYGSVPIARATGGLLDTIVDCDAALETGTGFLFDDPTPQDITSAVQRALSAFASPRWPALRRRVMRLDVGWDRSAHRYEQLYRSLATP
jgi:starch synthase